MLETIRDLLADKFELDPEDITMDASFKGDLGLDSLDLFEMLLAMEEEFDTEVDTDALTGFSTVGDVVRYMEENGFNA